MGTWRVAPLGFRVRLPARVSRLTGWPGQRKLRPPPIERAVSREIIRGQGRAYLKGSDEWSVERKPAGRARGVHKPVVRAATPSRSTAPWQKLRREFARLLRRRGEQSLVPVYMETGACNLYLQKRRQAGRTTMCAILAGCSAGEVARR